jgi:glucokinase
MQALNWAIGVDIGGTKIATAGIDIYGNILQLSYIDTPKKREGEALYENVLSDVSKEIAKLCAQYTQPPVGIGVAIAGRVSLDKTLVHFAPNLKWENKPLLHDLIQITQLPVQIMNDVYAATIAEWIHGAGKDCNNFLVLFLGTGIGGGIVSNGSILEGASRTAGEVGHIIVDMQGRLCSCGQRGCLEAYAGGWAIAEQAKEGNSPLIRQLSKEAAREISAHIVAAAYRQRDSVAEQVMQKARLALSSGVISLVHTFNPERVILGGGILQGFPEMVGWVEEDLRARAIPLAIAHLKVLPAHCGTQAAALGAASAILRTYLHIEEKNSNLGH